MNESKKWLGLIPVDIKHVRKHTSVKHIEDIQSYNTDAFDYARKAAATDFLNKELNLYDINIEETKLSNNSKSGIMWVKIGDRNRIKIMSQIGRLAKGKKLNIRLISKIPQQFWERNKVLENLCYNERQLNPNLRTQVRLGKQDLELMTKHKDEMFWRSTPNEAYGQLPEPETEYVLKTPEGRQNKRGANTPLDSEVSKKTNLGSTPEDITV